MNKVLLVYFSGTGNTRKIANEYRAALEAHGAAVDVFELPLSGETELAPSEYDCIGIGYPIHGFNAPKIVLDFCKTLPKRDKTQPPMHAFVFKTSGEPVRMSDVSSLKLRKILKSRGYAVMQEYQYVMPYNIIFRHSDAAAYKMWETAKPLVRADVDEILQGKSHLPRKVFMGGAIAGILRVEHPGAKLIGRGFKTTKACSDCGLCVKNCPAANIKRNKKGKIVFGGNCMICMRCVFCCPHDAIKPGILKGWKVNGKYSFEPPQAPEEKTKHDNYCKKAYDRYYANAEERISAAQNDADIIDN